MRTRAIAALFILMVACNRDRDGGNASESAQPQALDPSQLQDAHGEVTLTDGGAMSYEITSERYKQWYAAQQSLDHATAAKFGKVLHPESPSATSIDQATIFLERNPRTKQAIEHSGMSVRDFVQMTVALQQQFRDAAHASGDAYAQDLPYYVPPPLDTTMPPPPVSTAPPGYTPMPTYTPPPVYPPVQPVQPVQPADTTGYGARRDPFLDSLRRIRQSPARPPTVTSIPAPRADSVAPKRDSAPPVVVPPVAPRPRDTTTASDHDTTRAPAPRDSLRRQ
jgi:hypothetical protein